MKKALLIPLLLSPLMLSGCFLKKQSYKFKKYSHQVDGFTFALELSKRSTSDKYYSWESGEVDFKITANGSSKTTEVASNGLKSTSEGSSSGELSYDYDTKSAETYTSSSYKVKSPDYTESNEEKTTTQYWSSNSYLIVAQKENKTYQSFLDFELNEYLIAGAVESVRTAMDNYVLVLGDSANYFIDGDTFTIHSVSKDDPSDTYEMTVQSTFKDASIEFAASFVTHEEDKNYTEDSEENIYQCIEEKKVTIKQWDISDYKKVI